VQQWKLVGQLKEKRLKVEVEQFVDVVVVEQRLDSIIPK
jgi:hypothetical protein